MSLPLITSKRFLQFVTLNEEHDPDSFINTFSFNNFLEIIKKPQPLVNFIFNESSKVFSLVNADEKISFDRYLDEIIETIKDKKIKYFYKSEIKSLFFNKIKQQRNKTFNKPSALKTIDSSLYKKQILSFIAGFINHKFNRKKLLKEFSKLSLFDNDMKELLNKLEKPPLVSDNADIIINSIKEAKYVKIIKKCVDSNIYQLFPYSSPNYDEEQSLEEIKKSCQNLNTRLLNLKKINKSLDSFVSDSSQLNWDELQKINAELSDNT